MTPTNASLSCRSTNPSIVVIALLYAEKKFLATKSTVVVANIILLFEASFTKNTR